MWLPRTRLRVFLSFVAAFPGASAFGGAAAPDPPVRGAVQVLALSRTMALAAWISDHELLLVELEPFRLFRRDLNTGKDVRLGALEALAGFAITFRVSPDGRRVLWLESRVTGVSPLGFSTGREAYAHVADLDGSRHRFWRLKGAGLPYWMHDSKHLVEVAGMGPNAAYMHLLVRDSLHPRSARQCALKLPRKVNEPAVIACTADDALLITDRWQGLQPAIRIAEVCRVPISAAGKARRAFAVRLPAPSHIWATNDDPTIVFAPDGRHIAWLLKTDSPDADYMNLPTELWVSTTSGTDWHLLGKQPADEVEPNRTYRNMVGLQWTPDGKRLSFCYDGFLWVTSDSVGR